MVLSIISNNCWGSEYYKEQKIEYNTPFVGLFLEPDDYLALLANFRVALEGPLDFLSTTRRGPKNWPIGVLRGGIEINFMHYKSRSEAKEKWDRRKARLPNSDSDLFIKFCDRELFTQHHLNEFERLNYSKKICFLKKGRFNIDGRDTAFEIETSENSCPDGAKLWNLMPFSKLTL